jgi:hypothetical protein
VPSQKEAGTRATGFVTEAEIPGPRKCSECEHFKPGLRNDGYCNGDHVRRDPELIGRRNNMGMVRVAPGDYCWFFEPK